MKGSRESWGFAERKETKKGSDMVRKNRGHVNLVVGPTLNKRKVGGFKGEPRKEKTHKITLKVGKQQGTNPYLRTGGGVYPLYFGKTKGGGNKKKKPYPFSRKRPKQATKKGGPEDFQR